MLLVLRHTEYYIYRVVVHFRPCGHLNTLDALLNYGTNREPPREVHATQLQSFDAKNAHQHEVSDLA